MVLATDVLVLLSSSSMVWRPMSIVVLRRRSSPVSMSSASLTRVEVLGAAAVAVTAVLVAWSSTAVVDELDDELDELDESSHRRARPRPPPNRGWRLRNRRHRARILRLRRRSRPPDSRSDALQLLDGRTSPTSWCAYVAMDTTHDAERLGGSVDALGHLAVLVADLDPCVGGTAEANTDACGGGVLDLGRLAGGRVHRVERQRGAVPADRDRAAGRRIGPGERRRPLRCQRRRAAAASTSSTSSWRRADWSESTARPR